MPGTVYLTQTHGPKGEHTAINLLGGHSIKLPSKYIALYPVISMALKSSSEKFV